MGALLLARKSNDPFARGCFGLSEPIALSTSANEESAVDVLSEAQESLFCNGVLKLVKKLLIV